MSFPMKAIDGDCDSREENPVSNRAELSLGVKYDDGTVAHHRETPLMPIMIMGCSSDAGKSFLVAALCRILSRRYRRRQNEPPTPLLAMAPEMSKRQRLRVAPFKAQNMSNNAAVTRDGLEIAVAQRLQARAAQCEEDVRMNPVLLKPTSDVSSQVIICGKPDPNAAKTPWMARKPIFWPVIQKCLESLQKEFDILVIEGAGSPAEVNLRESDIVNMEVALAVGADVFLVADIDRGGAFAHLLGTYLCLSEAEKALVKGFVLNKFRGDPSLLAPAIQWLAERTNGTPTVAVVPMISHFLPEEDTFRHRRRLSSPAIASRRKGGSTSTAKKSSGNCEINPESENQKNRRNGPERLSGKVVNIALIAYPYASNLDEFDSLIHEEGVNVVAFRDLHSAAAVRALGGVRTSVTVPAEREHESEYHQQEPSTAEISSSFDCIILPGSKNVEKSLSHLRKSGIAAEISKAARRGVCILGICGGMQMLGHIIKDPEGIDNGKSLSRASGFPDEAKDKERSGKQIALNDNQFYGMGLLDVSTTIEQDKVTRQREYISVYELSATLHVNGYEIHHGSTTPGEKADPYLSDDLGWREDNIIGVYLHGLFANTNYRKFFISRLSGGSARERDSEEVLDDEDVRGERENDGAEQQEWEYLLDSHIEFVADAVEQTGFAEYLDRFSERL